MPIPCEENRPQVSGCAVSLVNKGAGIQEDITILHVVLDSDRRSGHEFRRLPDLTPLEVRGSCNHGTVRGQRFWDFRDETWTWKETISCPYEIVRNGISEAFASSEVPCEFARDIELALIILAIDPSLAKELGLISLTEFMPEHPVQGILRTRVKGGGVDNNGLLVNDGFVVFEDSFITPDRISNP